MARWRHAVGALAVLALLVLFSPVAGARSESAPVADWPRFHFDLGSTGYNTQESTIDPTNVGQLEENWAIGPTGGSPAIAGGMVYIGTGQGLTAIDQVTGAEVWHNSMVTSDYSTPAVADGVVYVGRIDRRFYAVDAATGAILWRGRFGGTIFSSPVVAGGFVVVGSDRAIQDRPGLYAFPVGCSNPCHPVWKATPGGLIQGSPSVAGGVVYVGSGTKNAYGYDVATGAPVWRGPTADRVTQTVVVTGGTAYVVSNRSVIAYPTGCGQSCSPSWTVALPTKIGAAPAVADGVVYVQANASLYALDSASGAVHWTAHVGTDVVLSSSPAVANGVVYIVDALNNLQAFATSTGAPLLKIGLGTGSRPLYSSPTVANGQVFARGADDQLHAYHLPGS